MPIDSGDGNTCIHMSTGLLSDVRRGNRLTECQPLLFSDLAITS